MKTQDLSKAEVLEEVKAQVQKHYGINLEQLGKYEIREMVRLLSIYLDMMP